MNPKEWLRKHAHLTSRSEQAEALGLSPERCRQICKEEGISPSRRTLGRDWTEIDKGIARLRKVRKMSVKDTCIKLGITLSDYKYRLKKNPSISNKVRAKKIDDHKKIMRNTLRW